MCGHCSWRLALVTLAMVAGPEHGRAQTVAYTGRLQYATGDFIFAQRTSYAYFANGLTVGRDRLQVSASFPVVIQSMGWLQHGGTGMMIPTGSPLGSPARSTTGTGRVHDSSDGSRHDMLGPFGIGDPIARIDVSMWRTPQRRASLKVVGLVKAPLASGGRGLGTGEWDEGAGLSGALRMGQASLLGEVVYWNLGNPPNGRLRDAVAYTVSVGKPFTAGRWSIVGNVSGASALWTGYAAPVQVGVSVGHLLKSGRGMFATLSAGLTRTAPSFTMGIGWRIPLGAAQPAEVPG